MSRWPKYKGVDPWPFKERRISSGGVYKKRKKDNPRITKRRRDEVAHILYALSHPTRKKFIDALQNGEKTLQELAHLVHLSASGISKHLRILDEAGLILRVKNSKFVYCSLRKQPLRKAKSWLSSIA